MTRVLFVCLGNICRSPLAEAVFRHKVRERGVEHLFEIDSAGTSGYHDGAAPDRRSAETALRRGVELAGRSRKLRADDLRGFDYVVAMDAENLRELRRRAPAGTEDKIRMLCGDADVPDPYYGGERGFDDVLDQVDAACRTLLEELRPR